MDKEVTGRRWPLFQRVALMPAGPGFLDTQLMCGDRHRCLLCWSRSVSDQPTHQESLPFPLEAFAEATAMTLVPLSAPTCRFINARRRILQPMLDSSCSETPKAKKKTAQNRPVQRFWPDSIASGAAQPPSGDLAMSEGTGRAQGTRGHHRAVVAAIGCCSREFREHKGCAVAWFCV